MAVNEHLHTPKPLDAVAAAIALLTVLNTKIAIKHRRWQDAEKKALIKVDPPLTFAYLDDPHLPNQKQSKLLPRRVKRMTASGSIGKDAEGKKKGY